MNKTNFTKKWKICNRFLSTLVLNFNWLMSNTIMRNSKAWILLNIYKKNTEIKNLTNKLVKKKLLIFENIIEI